MTQPDKTIPPAILEVLALAERALLVAEDDEDGLLPDDCAHLRSRIVEAVRETTGDDTWHGGRLAVGER